MRVPSKDIGKRDQAKAIARIVKTIGEAILYQRERMTIWTERERKTRDRWIREGRALRDEALEITETIKDSRLRADAHRAIDIGIELWADETNRARHIYAVKEGRSQ